MRLEIDLGEGAKELSNQIPEIINALKREGLEITEENTEIHTNPQEWVELVKWSVNPENPPRNNDYFLNFIPIKVAKTREEYEEEIKELKMRWIEEGKVVEAYREKINKIKRMVEK